MIESGNQRLFIHAALLSPVQPPQRPGNGGDSGNGNSGDSDVAPGQPPAIQRESIPNCEGRTTGYISGYCTRVKQVTGQCGFPRGDPNYAYERDADDDGCACEGTRYD